MRISLENPIDVILKHEGGYVNHPNDKGGPTNYGITIHTYSKWLGRKATIEDVKNMSEQIAREIYEVNYLTGPRINLLPNPPMIQVLDMSVNHGPKNAIKMVQRVVNISGFGPIDIDGIFGPNTRKCTIRAIEKMNGYFNNALVEERLEFYNKIVRRNPSQNVFLKGWSHRAISFLVSI